MAEESPKPENQSAGLAPRAAADGAAAARMAKKPVSAGGRFLALRGALSPREALQPEAAPPPPERKKRPRLDAISGFLTFLLVLGGVLAFGAVYAVHRLHDPGPLAAEKVVLIAQGSDVPDIIEKLQAEGVIDSPITLNLALFAEQARSKLKAGEYLFKQNVALREVIDILVQGRSILHAVTIPEGLTSEQIVERLRENEVLVGDVIETPKEGFLLPETYKFQRGSSRDQILQIMARRQKQLLDEIWKRRAPDLPLRSPYELTTLASIVEKETGKADERPRIAGVFINRLRKHMRLQSDPTIVYGLVGGKGTLGRPIMRSEIDKPTPYNTYAIDGLPPGPIDNPGRAALEAVANPSRTQELYFVADGTGGHVFADSLEQHNRNVTRWRQIEHDAKDKLEEPDTPEAPPTPGKDKHSELPQLFANLQSIEEFSARAGAADIRLSVKPNAETIARLSPVMPGAAAPTPRNFADLPPNFGGDMPRIAEFEEAQITPATRAEADLDGPVGEDSPQGFAASYPVPSKLQADMRARAARYGAGEGAEGGRLAAMDEAGQNDPADANGAAMAYTQPAANGRPRILDASEGTALDPLKDKSWDLNSAKNVPQNIGSK